MVGVSDRSKPYRTYRQRKRHANGGALDWDSVRGAGSGPPPGGRSGGPGPGGRRPRRRRSWLRRWTRRVILTTLTVAGGWLAVAMVSFHLGVREANERVDPAVRGALSASDGPALTSATNFLIVGTDAGSVRAGDDPDDPGRSDTLILVRSDPASRRFAMLSIPRDLRVEIPGHGTDKVNAAYAYGGAPLVVDTVRSVTGLPIHHYIEVNFDGFKELVDALGGITINNPYSIISTPFDGHEWRFTKGEITLDGRRALAYARVRGNQLPSPGGLPESDLSRGERQQRVVRGIISGVLSPRTLLHPHSVPRAAAAPLNTQASAHHLAALGLAQAWATSDQRLQCRLGGELAMLGGISYVLGTEDNGATIRMFMGRQPPLRPNLADNPYGPGCFTGEQTRQRDEVVPRRGLAPRGS